MTPLVFAVSAGFFNALWTAQAKKILKFFSPRIFTFGFRLLTSLFLLPAALWEGRWRFPAAWWGLMALAALFEGLRIWLLTLGVRRDYYATYAFYNLSPFFTVMLAPPLLGEARPPTLWIGAVFISLGAFFFHRVGSFSKAGFWGALLSAGGAIAAKAALAIHPSPFVFSFLTFTVGAVFLWPLEGWGKLRETALALPKIFTAAFWPAFWSFCATALFYTALAEAPASKVNPLVRANLLFGFFISYAWLKERKHWRNRLLAGGLISAGIFFIFTA